MAEIIAAQEEVVVISWPKQPKTPRGWHSLIRLRDAKVAHEVLGGSDYTQVRLCTVCQRHKKTCPHQEGEEPHGECPSFILDEHDIAETEARMMAAIMQPFRNRNAEQLAA